jgi:hypothetical protein
VVAAARVPCRPSVGSAADATHRRANVVRSRAGRHPQGLENAVRGGTPSFDIERLKPTRTRSPSAQPTEFAAPLSDAPTHCPPARVHQLNGTTYVCVLLLRAAEHDSRDPAMQVK